jgi:hypothetical protein
MPTAPSGVSSPEARRSAMKWSMRRHFKAFRMENRDERA